MATKTKKNIGLVDTYRYMVTDKISGVINNRKITALRGQVVFLNQTEYNVFKDKVLLIPEE